MNDFDESEDDPRLMEVAREYLAELERGVLPNRQAYLARHPDLADAMKECLDGIELAHGAARTLRPAPAPALPVEQMADPLGDFRIIREVGRGGMGIVYEAMQLSLGRRVALKVLPFAAGLDAKRLQRFKTEAHAAAQLHHTNIVPVYAVGCDRGMHYYAMQLIEGRPLDAVVRELHYSRSGQPPTVDLAAQDPDATTRPSPETSVARSSSRSDERVQNPEANTLVNGAGPTSIARGTPSPHREGVFAGRKGYRSAARMAAQVADALEYAHDSGVIHRDIKPANLLLDGKGNIWVADFGLAQVSADINLTQTGDVFGTMRYMSPEQASGRRVDVDHRTDVYSLGATLYELLTLEPIFPGNDRQSLLKQILDEEPRPLRLMDRAIPEELETIVLKSVAKSPSDRYATAAEMAADLRRFLDERPILARRPSLIDQSRKWMRRHPSIVGAAVILLVCGFLGLAVSTALIAREQARTEAAYQQERQRAGEAEQRFRLARQSVDDMIEIAEEEMDGPQFESVRKRMLEAAVAYYQQFIDERRDDPDAQAELAVTRDRVKKLLADLAVMHGAGRFFLLGESAVREDLKLSEEQESQVAELAKRASSQREALGREMADLSSDERRTRFLATARANNAAVSAILAPGQIERLRQIELQCQGPTAFREAEVATALGLSVEQRERIRAIEGDTMMSMGSPRHEGPGPRPDGPPPGGPGGFKGKGPPPHHDGPPPRGEMSSQEWQRRLQQSMEKVLAVLTPPQRKQWKEMTGEPFTGPMPPFFSRRGGPPGMGGPPPGGPPPGLRPFAPFRP